jgi:HK97 gp10 family phage protein
MPVRFNRRRIAERVKRATARGLVRATEDVRNEAITLIQNSPATGRTYQRRGVTHVASSPGNPPRTDTGTLINSIRTKFMYENLTGIVNAGARYAAPLEFGTQRIEPRPFMRPALANKRRDINKFVREEVRAELRRR